MADFFFSFIAQIRLKKSFPAEFGGPEKGLLKGGIEKMDLLFSHSVIHTDYTIDICNCSMTGRLTKASGSKHQTSY
jgi:hypothetical protein